MPTRRMILISGGSALALTGAGLGGLWLKSDLAEARQPWDAAGRSFGDTRLDVLAYAILAPNPHNMQPWRVRLDGSESFTLFVDRAALLPATDPLDRQIVVGLGAFLELMRLAAAERGISARITPFPEGDPQPRLDARPIARVDLLKDASALPDPLFKAALSRRTARVPFEPTPVEPAVLAMLGKATRFERGETAFAATNEAGMVEPLKRLCREGWETEVFAKAPHAESVRLTRIGAAEIRANPDGIALGGMAMEAMGLAGLLTRETMADPASTAHEQTLAFYNGLIDTAAAFGWLTTPANTRADQLHAGADWVRINLAATRAGLAMHPLSQTLQEFPEMRDLYGKTHDLLGVAKPAVVQGLFRFGYAKAPPPAPRWPLEARLIRV